VNKDFKEGLHDGIPIALGYFAVSFSIGIIAKGAGLTALEGFMSSFFTRASAGEYGVYTLIASNAAYVELILMSIIINLRYLLMSAALSQKIAPGTSLINRTMMSVCITDEIFGISIGHKGFAPPAYVYGAALISTVFWASGCATGIVAGEILPYDIVAALSMSLYGMFIAIIVPQAKKDRNVMLAIIASFICSGLFSVIPVLKDLSPGMRIIWLTLLISSVMAWLFPIEEDVYGEE
jgi:predicted branched-subunit amino acid permease